MQCHLLFKINLFIVLLVYTKFIATVIGSEDGTEIEGIPFCSPEHISTENLMKKIVLVSTLDGHLSAIDTSNDGSLLWTVKTGPEPLLSSSIHSLELTNNGQWIRMIPSLSGSLYRFNGQSMEAVPITTDSLLHSTAFLFSEGVVFSGGKETFTFGLDPKTGQVLYDCSMKRCGNGTEGETDVIVVRKVIQTIRAIDPRSGSEKWNFSVGQHELKLFLDDNAECHGANPPVTPLDFDVRVIVPQGLVCGVRDSHIMWSHKFDAPIVSAWQVEDNGKMVNIDLFGSSSFQFAESNVSPMLYIGMHKKQLYIQESVMLQHILGDKPSRVARIPWKPIPATGTALGVQEGVLEAIEGNTSNEFAVSDDGTTALSVLYASEYVNGNGYYLYGNKEELFGRGQIVSVKNPKCKSDEDSNNVTISGEIEDQSSEEENEETPVQVMIVSLWFWWKEVVLISVTTAIFVNILIQKFHAHLSPRNQIQYNQKEVVVLEDSSPGKPEKDSGVDLHLPHRSHSDPGPVASSEFVSRYLTDFDPVHCLGHGGFGVVFEAKNKIDDCHYAVKRIPLPNRAESRERVLREVKALAKLDHHNIVRYFNAWLECPPPGWLEEQDKSWPISAPSFYSDATSIDLSNHLKVANANDEPSISESIPFLNFRRRTSNGFTQSAFRKCEDANDDDDSSSFIKFESSRDCVKYADDDSSYIKFELTKDSAKYDDSIISISSVSDDTGSTCSYKDSPASLKRPSSLNVTSGGNVMIPPKLNGRMYLYIQMQLCQKESLREWLRRENVSRERERVLEMFLQIVDAVEYVHLQELIHRDLKPSNIFFSLDGQIKIGDFGLVTAMVESDQLSPVTDTGGRIFDEKHTAKVGTQLYMSPEQSAGLPYNYKVDIYSLGVILFELLVPFKTDMERVNVLTNVRKNNMPADFQKDFSEEFELLKLMLSHHPKERPTTFGIRAHPPFSKFRESLTSINSSWHFDLPSRRRASFRTLSGSSSGDSNDSQPM